jgi:hypothetical protein
LRIPGLIFSRPLRGLFWISLPNPSDKSLGYSHSVRFADEQHFHFPERLFVDLRVSQVSATLTKQSLADYTTLALHKN